MNETTTPRPKRRWKTTKQDYLDQIAAQRAEIAALYALLDERGVRGFFRRLFKRRPSNA